jgi:hypothetical protein
LRWSKLRASVEARFAEDVGRRVQLRSTAYGPRYRHIDTGRGWITVDGRVIFNACSGPKYISGWWDAHLACDTTDALLRSPRVLHHGHRNWNTRMFGKPGGGYTIRSHADLYPHLTALGYFNQLDFYESLHEYLRLSMDDILRHSNVLIRALGMLDYRVGKRRLRRVRLRDDEHSLVRVLWKLRLECEGLDARENAVS